MPESNKPKVPPREKAPVEGQLLFSIPQAARVLALSQRLVWEFVRRGALPTRVFGRRRLIHRRELEKFAHKDHQGMKETEQP
jgi:excisionase family DNA binding protein